MKIKNIIVLLPAILAITSCENGGSSLKISSVQNLRYENLAIYFDKVDNATSYLLEIDKNGEQLFAKDIKVNQYDIETLGLVGENTVTVTAYSQKAKSEPTSLTFTITGIDSDTIYEGEHGLLGYGDNNSSSYRNNSLAHNGAYAGGIDDCGQGLHWDHFAYVPGEKDFEIYYLTDYPGSYHSVYINGEKQAKALYAEKTGWGGIDSFNARKLTVKITLKQGWNSIELVRDGINTDNPEWGGFAEIDYVVIKGSGQVYSTEGVDTSYPTYKLQAEMGSSIKWDNANQAWTIKNPPVYYKNADNHYMVGNIDTEGEGVDIHWNAPAKGFYKIQIGYATANYTDPVFATVTTSEAPRYQKKVVMEEAHGWGTSCLSGTNYIELAQDGNHIYVKKLNGSATFELDYILLTYIGETEPNL